MSTLFTDYSPIFFSETGYENVIFQILMAYAFSTKHLRNLILIQINIT